MLQCTVHSAVLCWAREFGGGGGGAQPHTAVLCCLSCGGCGLCRGEMIIFKGAKGVMEVNFLMKL